MILFLGIVSVFGSVFAFVDCLQSNWSMISVVCLVSCIISTCLFIKLASMEEALKSLKKEFEEEKESFEHYKIINNQNIHTLKDEIDALKPENQTEPTQPSTTETDNEETKN